MTLQKTMHLGREKWPMIGRHVGSTHVPSIRGSSEGFSACFCFALLWWGFFVSYIVQISFLVHSSDHNKKGKRVFTVYIK